MDMTPIASSAFAGLLERATGQELVAGRRWRIEAELGPVMRAHGLDSLDRLAAAIGRNHDSPLAITVVEALLNNETFFFRDAGTFQALQTDGLAALAEARRETRRLRIWSAACSTGQEVYSLAMSFARDPARWAGWNISILGTDISKQALTQARRGVYSQMEVQRGLPIGDLLRNFEQEGDDWRINPSLRANVSFVQHNLLDPAPGCPFDLILCRNVLIYLTPDRRRQVLERLGAAIMPDGLLMMGAGETVVGSGDAFAAHPDLRGLYRRTDVADGAGG